MKAAPAPKAAEKKKTADAAPDTLTESSPQSGQCGAAAGVPLFLGGGPPGKLTAGSPGDPSESDRLTEAAKPSVPIFASVSSERRIQRRAGGGPEPSGVPPIVDEVLHSPGKPLEESSRCAMESRFGQDFAAVRVHDDAKAGASAQTVNALAYTVGPDIVFAPGQFSPSSPSGQRLLTHELTHVVQQAGAPVPESGRLSVSKPTDASEREATAAANGGTVTAQSGGVVLARDTDPSVLCGSMEFYEEYKIFIWSDLIESAETISLDPGSLYAYWLFGRNDAVATTAIYSLRDATWTELQAILSPGDADAAISRGRDTNEAGKAPKEYRMEAAMELRGLLVPRLQESIQRIAPQYVAASYLAMKKYIAQHPGGLFTDYPQVVPDASSLMPSHPIDKAMIRGLIGRGGTNGQLEVNFKKYIEDGKPQTAEADLKKLHPIKHFTWEALGGTWMWVRVTDPANASREDVANELYDDPAKANSILGAAPLFGFNPILLTKTHFDEWAQQAGAEAAARLKGSGITQSQATALFSVLPPIVDPAREIIESKLSDEAALSQAKTAPPTGESQEKIAARMRLSVQLLSEIGVDATYMGLNGSAVSVVQSKIDERSRTVAASIDPTESMRWDAHSAAEYAVIRAVASGLRTSSEQFKTLTQKPAGVQTDAGLPSYVPEPLKRVAQAYLDAASVAELVETAQERLAEADNKSKLYPIEMMDGLLQYAREILSSPKKATGADLKTEVLSNNEKILRAKVLEARELLVKDPAKFQEVITELQQEVSDLQDEASMVSTMDSANTLWEFMLHHRGIVGDMTGKSEAYEQAMDTITFIHESFYDIYLDYMSDDLKTREKARGDFAKFTQEQGPAIKKQLDDIAAFIEDEETKEKWVTLGLKLTALIAIAVFTAGVGAYVSGALLTGAGWGATTAGIIGAGVVASGAEALSFTALSTMVLGRDPNRGLVMSFLENWALFGALKGLSIAYEAAFAAKSGSLIVKSGNIALGLAASIGYSLAKANSEAKANNGKGLTNAQAEEMIGEQLIVFIGTALVARYAAGGFLEFAKARGEESFLADFARVDEARTQALRAASALNKKSAISQAVDALGKDAEALNAEIDALKRMEEFARSNPYKAKLLGIDTSKLAEMRSVNEAALDARERAAIALELEFKGGDLFECKPGRLSEILARYKKLGDIPIEQTDPVSGAKSATIQPKGGGPQMRIVEGQPAEAKPLDPARFKLTAMFMSLSEEAQSAFSRWVEKLGPERALKKFEGMAKSKMGLDDSLRKDAEAEAKKQETRKPFGAALDQVADLQAEIGKLKDEVNASNIPGLVQWLKRLNHEMSLLEDMSSGKIEAKAEQVQGVRNNVEGVRGEFEDAAKRGATRANVKVNYTNEKGKPATLDIDNVKDDKIWSEVKNKNPFTIESKDWTDEVKPKAEKMMAAARQNGVTDIRFSFPKGVDPSVKAALEAMNPPPGDTMSPRITVEGDVKLAGQHPSEPGTPTGPGGPGPGGPKPRTLGAPGGRGQMSILVVGAERPDEFTYASESSRRGANVTVVNPVATPASAEFTAAGGNFVQGRIEGLPREPNFNLIREDFPFPLGRAFHPTAEFAGERMTRLAPGGHWVVVTESSEFAHTLHAAAERPGFSVSMTEVPVAHEGTPQSSWTRETNRYILDIQNIAPPR